MTVVKPVQIHNEERAVLIGTQTRAQHRWEREDLMQELQRLTISAGGLVVHSMIQNIQQYDPATFIGSGKVAEIRQLCQELEADVVIFNEDLSPVQQKNLENAFECKVIDRTALILDIFAQRAFTREGKLQVELAQLQYMLPRLTRMWTHLSRLGGGIGTRGPGETQLETDKRKTRIQITRLKKQLKEVSKQRGQHRQARKGVPIPVVALVGYTNSGKSTLFEKLTGTATLVEDKLFATLDPLVRCVTLANRQKMLVLDTVGFIRNLPVQLVAAFRATLEEIAQTDLLVHVIDLSHPLIDQHIATVQDILKDLKSDHLPQIQTFNKIDLVNDNANLALKNDPTNDRYYVSALHDQGLGPLMDAIMHKIQGFRKTITLTIPYENREATNFIHRYGTIIKADYNETAVNLTVELDLPKAEKIVRMLEQSQ
ncbi:GTPase HflX [bacterium]|nr:GTPase HflX [bacterium]